MRTIRFLIVLVVLAVLGGAAFVWSGIYPVGADVPHSPFVLNLMQMTRQRSIALRAKDIPVPPLDDQKLVAAGAEHYGEMCTGCHLAPGMGSTDFSMLARYLQPETMRTLELNRMVTATEITYALDVLEPLQVFGIREGILVSS